jgi:outer membrane protein assembly factor BamE
MFSLMRKSFFLLTLAGAFALAACSTVLNNLPGVYTLEIQQGNVVEQDMINQLKPGMSKKQVLYIMGSPMLMDVFHQKRWDYLYSKQLEGEPREQKRISLYFEGDILTGIQGDFKPDLQAAKVIKETTVEVPKRDLEETMWEKISGLFSSEPELKPVIDNAGLEKATDDKANNLEKLLAPDK